MTTYKRGLNKKLSSNFYLREFECKCGKCKNTILDNNLILSVQKIRDKFNKPVIINSAYRCAKHNKAVGGATLSKHLFGMAADIVVKGAAPQDVAAYAEAIGIKGIGLYPTFVHIDTRRAKSFWYGQQQEPRATFGSINLREVAEAVIDGAYGTGATRKKKLEAAGYNYAEVQALVNELLRKQEISYGAY